MKKSFVFLSSCFTVLVFFNGYSQEQASVAATDKSEPGSSLLPVPQKVSLSTQRYLLDESWSVRMMPGLSREDPAVVSLLSQLKERFGIKLNIASHSSSGRAIELIIKSGAIVIEKTTDSNRTELKKQAYSLQLQKDRVTIVANAGAGLFYGVQTFMQLLQPEVNATYFAGGKITDWPDMNMRMIYWDDAHHLERLDAMKRAIKQASFYKINKFSLKLEGHFQFSSASALIEPYAYTPAEYQELTDYARAHYVELVPYLDAPAHIAFILKHPEYAGLRAFPNSNYELNVMDPKADELILGMMNDLINANKGGKHFMFSTDEAYYVGMSETEKKPAEAAGGKGALFAEYITRIANKLHDKGRKSVIWGEFPLTPSDISSLPSHIINGVYDEKTAGKFKDNKMRQLVYVSAEGEEPFFPNYYNIPLQDFSASNSTKVIEDEEQQGIIAKGRVAEVLDGITSAIKDGRPDFMGVIVAGWADAGLNPETFWLGCATGASAAWNSRGVTAQDLTNRFYNSFYGNRNFKMERVYQLLSTQAEFWDRSWDWERNKNRTPIFGYSAGIFDTPRLAKDQTLPFLPVPSGADLSLNEDWNARNSVRLQAAEKYLVENNELMNLLQKNMAVADQQQYNLLVLQSVAQLCRQNLNMLLGLQRINNLLSLSSNASSLNAGLAVSLLDQALDQVKILRDQRNETLQDVTAIWYQDWFPRVHEANGRKFLDAVDDVKDHRPARTVDMSYLIYRQLKFPLGKWAEDVLNARNQFANKHSLPLKSETFNWESIDL